METAIQKKAATATTLKYEKNCIQCYEYNICIHSKNIKKNIIFKMKTKELKKYTSRNLKLKEIFFRKFC